MTRRGIVLSSLLSLFCLWVLWPPAGAAQSAAERPAMANPYAELTVHANAMVTVHFLVRLQMPGVDQEIDNEITCLAISADGLVLCSNTELGGAFGAMARLMGQSDSVISSLPRDLRVVLADGSAELDADLVARDSDRDLAWVLIREMPDGVEFPILDFAEHAEPEVGDPLYLLRRMDPFFGSAPVVADASVAAVLDRPRHLIVPSRAEGHLGAPVFAADGRLLGVVVAQIPGNDDSRAVMTSRSRSLPGQSGKESDMVGGVILPAADVVRATELAREVWARDQSESLE